MMNAHTLACALLVAIGLLFSFPEFKSALTTPSSLAGTTSDGLVHLNTVLVNKVKAVYHVPSDRMNKIVQEVEKNAHRKKLDPVLILAVIAQESGFNPKVVSHNDHGLMQINTRWQKALIRKKAAANRLMDIAVNIDIGTDILKKLCDSGTRCNRYQMLRKYNGVKSNDYPEQVLAKYARFKQWTS